MYYKINRRQVKGVMLAALLLFAAPVYAISCPTDTLANVIALGNCDIGDATLSFGPAMLPPRPIYDPGPFAGDSGPGPTASQIQFVPDTTINNPGFTLNGNFTAMGGFSCKYGSGLCGNGNLYDESLGYFSVAASPGKVLVGDSIALLGATVSTDDPNNHASASLISLYTHLDGNGASLLSNAETFGTPVDNKLYAAYLRTWNRTGNPSSQASYTGVSFNFNEAVTAVPLPPAVWLFGSGLLGLVGIARRKARGMTIG